MESATTLQFSLQDHEDHLSNGLLNDLDQCDPEQFLMGERGLHISPEYDLDENELTAKFQ